MKYRDIGPMHFPPSWHGGPPDPPENDEGVLTWDDATLLEQSMNLDVFIAHLIDPVLPESIPTEFAMRGHTSHDDPFARFVPGLEGAYLADRATGLEIGFVVHAIIDRDYQGQFLYLQVCRRTSPDVAFGHWHYGFYYRGGDSSWDVWTLDINHGSSPPAYAAFGAYVDGHLSSPVRQ